MQWQVQVHYVSIRNQLIMLIQHIHSLLTLKAAKLWKRKKALSKSISSSKTVAIDTLPHQTTSNKTTINGQYAKKMKFRSIGSFMKTKLNLPEPCKDDTDRFGKGFCISIVHSGVSSCLSNNAMLENYLHKKVWLVVLLSVFHCD